MSLATFDEPATRPGPARTDPGSSTRRPSSSVRRRLDVAALPGHRDRLFRAAYALCQSREDAEDLVQETFARVLRRPRLLRRENDLSYLLKALRNTWISAYQERARRPTTVAYDDEIEFVLDAGAEEEVSAVELRIVYELIGELSPPLREVLVAVDIVGLSYRDAATALDVPQGTVMSRLSRARDSVARRLQQAGLAPAEPG